MRARCFAMALLLLAGAAPADDAPMGVSIGPQGLTVRVWAPHAQRVELIGEFNSWNASDNDRLQKDEASGIWSVTQKRGLPRGAYQFLINGELRRRDPYARAVSPDGRSSLFYDPQAFKWEGDQPLGYALEDLVIYELHIGAFYDPDPRDGKVGTFGDATKRLDQLVSLGVNGVCVMPLHEFNGSRSWGYNPSDLFAVEQAYGGPDGFKQFVKECHRRGLAVHLDIVHNHYGPENLDLLRFDGSGGDREGGIYFYEGPGIGMTPWGPRVRFEDPQVRRFVRDNAMMWLEEYHVDGFRWDSTVNIRAYDQGAQPLPAGAEMLDAINREIRERFPDRLSIAEDSLDIGSFHGSWDYDFHHEVMYLLGAVADPGRSVGPLLSAVTRRPQTMGRVIYVDNHDEAGKINGQFRMATDVDAKNPDSEHARRLCALGAVLTLTAPGTPLLFMGNEAQQGGTFHENIPVEWGRWKTQAGLVRLHRDLIRLRRNLEGRGAALKGPEVELGESNEAERWCSYIRGGAGSPDDQLVVVLNVSAEPRVAVVTFPSGGSWQTLIDTHWPTYGGAAASEDRQPMALEGTRPRFPVRLPPYSARLFGRARGMAAARKVELAPPPKPSAPKPAFSLYASVNLIGDFNDWNLTNTPMKLTGDGVWERSLKLSRPGGTALKLSANEDGKIFWGAGEPMSGAAPYQGSVARLGGPITLQGPLDGTYRVRFQEEALSLTVDPAAAEPEIDLRGAVRTWTARSGVRLPARLIDVEGELATLERTDGKRVQVKLDSLIDEDRALLEGARGAPAP